MLLLSAQVLACDIAWDEGGRVRMDKDSLTLTLQVDGWMNICSANSQVHSRDEK